MRREQLAPIPRGFGPRVRAADRAGPREWLCVGPLDQRHQAEVHPLQRRSSFRTILAELRSKSGSSPDFAPTSAPGSNWGGTLSRAPAAIGTFDRMGTPAGTSPRRIVASPAGGAACSVVSVTHSESAGLGWERWSVRSLVAAGAWRFLGLEAASSEECAAGRPLAPDEPVQRPLDRHDRRGEGSGQSCEMVKPGEGVRTLLRRIMKIQGEHFSFCVG